jgi:hypothetical protein
VVWWSRYQVMDVVYIQVNMYAFDEWEKQAN